jgi:uncharacterized membrane protein
LHIRILKNKFRKLKKKQDRTLWLSHGMWSYICMYINAVAGSVMFQLYLRHDFDKTILKIKHKLYIASGSALLHPPPPQRKILGVHLSYIIRPV